MEKLPGLPGKEPVRAGRYGHVGPLSVTEIDADAWYDVLAAAHRHDRPNTPAPERDAEAGRLYVPALRSRSVAFALPDPGAVAGTAVGYAGIALVRLFDSEENAATAFLDTLTVHPGRRGRGVGGALWSQVRALLVAEGRTSLTGLVHRGGAGERFATGCGAECALPLVAYVQTVAGAVDMPGVAGAAGISGTPGSDATGEPGEPKGSEGTEGTEDAEGSRLLPDGYRFAAWSGLVPDEHAATHARAHNAMQDAPIGDLDEQHDPWDADRVRATTRVILDRGGMMLTVAAIAEADGTVAGYTELVLPTPDSVRALQYDTAVIPEHRGRGLGRAVKLRMLAYLRARRPGVREIMTTVAEGNAPMLAVNAALGYRAESGLGIYQVRI
ncbi:GNAT family N-acetyltransferase [Streptomyces kasugaensis]|uniref:GNAT family N-acetyltransferase n=1 Tax=Streptomyces kasugaensis TaxID=1946 RepID=A0A4Q9HKD7_STRKA|nr:GNAT family N-acetyltransferase [Streptomyces kasugaensis]TBO55173.1 GNAT family N-acetyltransferase [Streptomyces kasugaensis]